MFSLPNYIIIELINTDEMRNILIKLKQSGRIKKYCFRLGDYISLVTNENKHIIL
jgi:hypothetical protein